MQDQRQKVTSICSECGAPVTFPLGSFQITCEHCQAGLAVEQGTTLVRLDCPNCGGNFFYIDGALTSKCPYCDSALLVLCQQRLLRYLILPRAKGPDVSADAYLMLLPFWNLRGLLYCWQVGSRSSYEESPHPSSTNDMDGYYSGDDSVPSGSIKVTTGPRKVFGGRVVNLSLPDPATLFYGIGSLRLRASLNPLEPFSQHHESLGEIPPLRLDHVQAKEQLLDLAIKYTASVERLTQIDLQRIDMVADELSLIYYPFWIAKTQNQTKAVWDGVSGEPEPLQPPHEGSMPSVPVLFDHLKVIQLTCGRCSQELAPGNHATVLPCFKCDTFWQVTREGLQPISAHCAKPLTPSTDATLWLPFWLHEIQLSYSGNKCSRVADLIQKIGILRAPGNLPRANKDSPLAYYSPAYGNLRAPRVDYAARDMTRVQPKLEAQKMPQEQEFFNCFFNAEDAKRLAYATWLSILPGAAPNKLRSLRITVGRSALWYIPFAESNNELVNLLTGYRYDRAAFRGVRH